MKAPVKSQNYEVVNLVGLRFREIRKESGWTLSEVSKRTGISKGTLSKLENGKTYLNFSSVNKLANGLQLPVSDLTNPHVSVPGKRAVTRAMSGTVFESVDMDYEVLCSDIDNAQQGFIRAVVKAKAIDIDLPWHRHKGQEFVHVLRGVLELHSEQQPPLTLKVGDSIFFDASVGHRYISKGQINAEILITMSLNGYENVVDNLPEMSL